MKEKNSINISRRDFIKGAAVGAAGIATMGAFTACASGNDSAAVSWARNIDVLIVGSGAAGLSAAYEAAAAGSSVLILEKADVAGGTSNASGGVMQAAGTAAQKELTPFKDDTPEKHAQLWIAEGEGFIDEALVRDMANGAPTHIDWVINTLGLKVASVYGHCQVPYVDSSLFADRIHVYDGGGVGGDGVLLIQAMLQKTLEKGATIEYNTEVTSLVTNAAGEVVGVTATADGKSTNIKANKCVVLCCSSIDWNEQMCRDLNAQQLWDITSQICACVKTNTGDGIRMGMDVGASVCGFGGTIDLLPWGAGTTNVVQLFPSFMVNKAGVRFVCEDSTYAFHMRAIFHQEKQTGAPTYTIFAESSLTAPNAPWTKETAAAAVSGGTLFTAATIEELAKAIDVDAAALKATLDTWNTNASAGKDPQYARKEGIAPLTGPFYASKNTSLNLGAIGGLKINTDAQVLKADGTAIPRLYAAGMNSGGWIGPYYPGSGTAIMGCLHWGRKAGVHGAALTKQ